VVQDVRKDHKNDFALAIAEGESIIAWAQENGVPERTAFRWAQDPTVRREAEATPCLGPGHRSPFRLPGVLDSHYAPGQGLFNI
jgi:hypothetical protein